jgi:DNA-binding GntR family transcriptional regulator
MHEPRQSAALDTLDRGRAMDKKAARAKDRARAARAYANTIYERIFVSIIEHRLPPGAKLGEDRLAAIFGVTRARIRQVIARLAHEGVVTVHANRGAFVAEPTIEQARDLFEARRLLEPPLAMKLASKIDSRKLARLRNQIAAEQAARKANDRRALIRLTGEFHLLLAEMGGNQVVSRLLKELESLTSLVIFLYDAPTMPACRDGDHTKIVDALTARNGRRAAAAMLRHLNDIEASLRLDAPRRGSVELEEALATPP